MEKISTEKPTKHNIMFHSRRKESFKFSDGSRSLFRVWRNFISNSLWNNTIHIQQINIDDLLTRSDSSWVYLYELVFLNDMGFTLSVEVCEFFCSPFFRKGWNESEKNHKKNRIFADKLTIWTSGSKAIVMRIINLLHGRQSFKYFMSV